MCSRLHVCLHYVNGTCRFGDKCLKSHNVFDPQPKAVLVLCGVDIERSNSEVLADLRACHMISTSTQLAGSVVNRPPTGKCSQNVPDVCSFYNVISGCNKDSRCTRLHICKHYISGSCKFGQKCKRSHNIFDTQPKQILRRWGVDVARSPKEVLAELRSLTTEKPQDCDKPKATSAEELSKSKDTEEVCTYHLHGRCLYGGNCKRHHCALPYQWQRQQTDGQWTDFILSDNIKCEQEYCDPENDSCHLDLPRYVAVSCHIYQCLLPSIQALVSINCFTYIIYNMVALFFVPVV